MCSPLSEEDSVFDEWHWRDVCSLLVHDPACVVLGQLILHVCFLSTLRTASSVEGGLGWVVFGVPSSGVDFFALERG